MTTTVSTTCEQFPALPHIPGYTVLQALYTGSQTTVYRALHIDSQQQVVIKVLSNPYPSCHDLTVFRNQYTIAKSLPVAGIVQPIALEPWQQGYALVVKDFGGLSLHQYIADHQLSVQNVLGIALQMTDILQGLGKHHVVHKDIKPANILIHPESKRIQLIDFSIATLLPKETQEIQSPSLLEGTLAYLAPEQTGRMNRGIDYRSDFYGLGVTLYKLLTGVLPFTETDPLELVHCHIAKTPVAPHAVNAAIPKMVSQVVLKLMAKNAEDRYQSALGLKHDLTKCLLALKETGEIDTFELGLRDVCDRFLIPEKLYGREPEIQTLLAAFERVSYGSAELMLIAGLSGVGKTAVVNEVHKPITQRHGYFIRGKFDQFNRNIPFSAFVQSFRSLMDQLLGESDAQLAHWKHKILNAVGEDGQLLIEVIPELETIIGVQPPVVALTGSEAQHRFNSILIKFVQVFTTFDHPLVLFLDDLQWADSASLALLSLLLGESASETGYLLVLGAYRDNEVFPAHPLIQTLNTIDKSNQAAIQTLTLAPLDQSDIASMVSEMLRCEEEDATILSTLVHQKTQGNPFFTTQFLKGLYAHGCITFEQSLCRWQCHFSQIQALALTDNVVAFMVKRLGELPDATQEVLKLAACIGNQFEMETLAAVCDFPSSKIAEALSYALYENLIIPENGNYKYFQGSSAQSASTSSLPPDEKMIVGYRFLHDRVQQAAYSLILADQKQIIHLKIGQRLLENTSASDQEKNLFTLVGQLNMGRELLTTEAERNHLIQLNLKAGKKAKLSTAYSAAIDYFATAQQLLADNSWEQNYQTTLAIQIEALEAAYLNTSFDAVEQLAAPILARSQTLLDTIKVHEIRIRTWIGLGDQHQALALGLDVLAQLGILLLEHPPQAPDDIAALIDAAVMRDPEKLAAMDIMAGIITSAWAVNPDYFRKLAFTMVALSIQHGNAPTSPFGYAWHGSILCEALGNPAVGAQFGQLAVALLDRLETRSLRSKVLNIYASTIGLWQGHAKQYFGFHLDGIQSGLDSGDLEFASYNAAEYAQYLFLVGTPLDQVREACQQKLSLIEHLKQDFHIQYLSPWLQSTLNLLGESDTTTALEGEVYSEQAHLQTAVEENQLTLVFVAYFLKTFLSYLFGEYEQALTYGEIANSHSSGVAGTLFLPAELFYVSLARLACFEDMDEPKQASTQQAVEAAIAQLKCWSASAPMNYQHKCALLEAELAKHQREFIAAMGLYDDAITGAKANGYLQEEALANERAAQFYLDWGKEKLAVGYLQEAYYCYSRWGAIAKTKALEKRYPHLVQRSIQPVRSTLNPFETVASFAGANLSMLTTSTQSTRSSSTYINNTLDLAAILKAAQALSETIQLDQLLCELTSIILQNSGGDRCALILADSDGQWNVESLATLTRTDTQTDLVSKPLEGYVDLPVKLIHYVKNTQKTIVIDNLKTNLPVIASYLSREQPKSVLCLPLLNQGQLLGILYLQNKAVSHTFSQDRLMVVNFLCAQAAISLKNARLYQQAQRYAAQIEQSQLQTVQNEKMASLGNLVAGVAHEINNPIGFLNGSVKNAQMYLQDLITHLDLYQQHYPSPVEEIEESEEDIDLEFIREDFPKLLLSMTAANKRIKSISTSLRTFSRADTEHKVSANLHEGLDSTLLILKYRLKANEQRPAVQVVQNYAQLPAVECFPGQLNQVFMNLLANAIDVFDEMAQSSSFAELKDSPQIITLTTHLEQNGVTIQIADNGKGMPDSVKERIFDHLFTTKAVGKGTGLGLAIARQIIIDTHGGTLDVTSELGKGSEFSIWLPLS
ncbi:MAG: AAA family ATPase [Cyanobacteria bacterium J06560_6]